MPSGDFPPVIEDTPPLSPSRSSVNSATRSSAASSSTNVALAGLSLRMSNMHLDGAPSHDSIDSVEQQASLPKSEPPSRSVREHGRDETNGVMQESEQEGSGQVDEPGPSEPGSRQRPVVPRQSSYSKRHSSFDSPREVPYPYGFLAPSQSRAGPSKSMLLERTGSLPGSSQEAQRQRQIFREAEANSLTDGSMQEESPSPPTSEQTESTSTSSSAFGRISLSEYQEAVREIMDRYSTTEEQLAALRSSITKSGIALPPNNNKNTPSPPFSVEEPSGDSAPYRYVPSITEQRTHHHSLPPPPPPRFGSIYTPHTAPSRPSSLPHITPSGHYSSLPTSAPLPPPSPPTILTPPPDVKDPSRKPAPYEPFLPREQLPAGNTFIAVQTLSSEYQLLVRLPGFQRDSITLAVRKRRVLHIVADSWSDSGGHFERRVSFGYDADLASVRAEFDGETLKIIVPRRTLQVIPAGYGYATSHE